MSTDPEIRGTSRNRFTVVVLGVAFTIAAAFGIVRTSDGGCAPHVQVSVEVDPSGSGEGSGTVIELIDVSPDVDDKVGSGDGSGEGSGEGSGS